MIYSSVPIVLGSPVKVYAWRTTKTSDNISWELGVDIEIDILEKLKGWTTTCPPG